MVRTEVGYAGGRAANPTYDDLFDHSESIRISYDPERIPYADLLALFWEGSHATRAPYARQYRSAILWQNEAQRDLALKTLEQEQQRRGKIHTAIEPLGTFTLAEDYHQKYYLRNTQALYREFKAIYPKEQEFVLSTAVARANGYLGGYGPQADLPRLGLSENAQQILRQVKPRPGCGG